MIEHIAQSIHSAQLKISVEILDSIVLKNNWVLSAALNGRSIKVLSNILSTGSDNGFR